MRVLLQRVRNASVNIADKEFSNINQGLLLFVAFESNDELIDIEWSIKKILQMRIFSDSNDKMNLSIEQISGDILIVSQFTLYASTKKGNRPSFIKSAPPDKALDLYNDFIKKFKSATQLGIQTGRFGADMKVSLINDGPVSILMDSRNKE